MNTLNFVMDGQMRWSAETTATKRYQSLHLERPQFGNVEIQLRHSSDQEWSSVYVCTHPANCQIQLDLHVVPQQMRVISSGRGCPVAASQIEASDTDSAGLTQLQEAVAEQQRINAEQQEQIEKNAAASDSLQQVLPVVDADGNGIPDGEDRLQKMEKDIAEAQPMSEEGYQGILGLIK